MYKCGNIGCKDVFKYRTQRCRHMAKCSFPAATVKEKKVIYIDGPDGSFLCNICRKQFAHKPAVFKHVNHGRCRKDTMYKEKDEWICTTCGKAYKYKSQLEIHKNQHLRPSFVCEKCDKAFKRKNFFEAHVKNVMKYNHHSY